MLRSVRIFAIACLFLALLAGCATLPKTMKGFDEITKEIKAVTVMPPAFTLEKIGAFTTQAKSDMTHDIELEINAAVEALITKSPYRLAVLGVTDSTLARDSELRQRLFEQNQEHMLVSKKIAETKGKTIDIDYAANIDYFADKTNAEYFLFLSGGGWFKSGGAKAKDVAALILFGSASPGSSTSMRAFLVDAKRGKVIWYNDVTIPDRDPRKPSHLQKTCEKLMVPLFGKIKMSYDKSRDEEIIEKYKAHEEQPPPAASEK